MVVATCVLGGCATPAEKRRAAAAIASLQSPDSNARLAAVTSLGKGHHSHEIVSALIGAMSDPSPRNRVAVLAALEKLGASPVALSEVLDDAVKDTNASVRYAALTLLSKPRYRHTESLPLLRNALRDSASMVRAAAAIALGQLGDDARIALDDLATATRDTDTGVAHEARDAIDRISGTKTHHEP